MSIRIQYAAWSCKGHVRSKNQDNLYCGDGFFLEENNSGMPDIRICETLNSTTGLFAVFDGMGGEMAGETAAYMAAKRLMETDLHYSGWRKALFPQSILTSYCKTANTDIDRYRRSQNYRAMGTTVAAILVQGRWVTICNVGDSRIYRYSGDTYRQISKDHTESYRFIGNAALTQYLGMPEEEIQIEPALSRFTYNPGDRYLLCTDGIWNCMSESFGHAQFLKSSICEQMHSLFDMVRDDGERDNATAILLELE